METVRWGILGTGKIAGEFAKSMTLLSGAKLNAVGSRSLQKARVFAETHAIPHCHSSYQELAEDPEVDVIYIATPHPLHAENMMQCLNAGKSVLCEKPFTLNAAQAARAIALAREKGLFLMEAMWSRFLPALVKVRQLISLGVIGQPRILSADFGFHVPFDPHSRLFAPELGGGALLDVGVYVLSLASMIFGEPQAVHSTVSLGQTGVDEQSGYLLQYANGAFASLFTAVSTESNCQAAIFGEKGSLHLPSPWFAAKKVTLKRPSRADEIFECAYDGIGFQFEIQEVIRCMRKGSLESRIMPLDETMRIMQTMDAIRAQWNLVYPSEKTA